jgi:hypothetical protein
VGTQRAYPRHQAFAIILELFGFQVGAIISDDTVGHSKVKAMDSMKLTAAVESSVVTGVASIHLVNLSTTTSR